MNCFSWCCSVGGVVLLSISTNRLSEPDIAVGALWSLCGAILYALYLVLLRRRVDNEDKLNIPMFFGEYRYCCRCCVKTMSVLNIIHQMSTLFRSAYKSCNSNLSRLQQGEVEVDISNWSSSSLRLFVFYKFQLPNKISALLHTKNRNPARPLPSTLWHYKCNFFNVYVS